MKMIKKAITVVLAVAIVLTMIPTMAFAANGTDTCSVVLQDENLQVDHPTPEKGTNVVVTYNKDIPEGKAIKWIVEGDYDFIYSFDKQATIEEVNNDIQVKYEIVDAQFEVKTEEIDHPLYFPDSRAASEFLYKVEQGDVYLKLLKDNFVDPEVSYDRLALTYYKAGKMTLDLNGHSFMGTIVNANYSSEEDFPLTELRITGGGKLFAGGKSPVGMVMSCVHLQKITIDGDIEVFGFIGTSNVKELVMDGIRFTEPSDQIKGHDFQIFNVDKVVIKNGIFTKNFVENPTREDGILPNDIKWLAEDAKIETGYINNEDEWVASEEGTMYRVFTEVAPVEPNNPDNQPDPEKPVTPDTNKPVNPDAEKPENPDVEKPENSNTEKPANIVTDQVVKSDVAKAPKTGDGSNIILWTMLMLGVAGTVVLVRRQKEK